MEHRLGTRRPVVAAVVVYPAGSAPLLAHTREVSISGMFIETAEALAANSVLEVEMTLPGTSGLKTFRWQAMVVRKTAGGAGLMFDRLRPPAINRLLANLDAGLIHDADSGLPAAAKVIPLRPPPETSARSV